MELNNNKEAKLIAQCKQNSRKAQMELYDMYCEAMLHTAYRFVKKKDEAQDIMQEAFLKAFRKIDTYNGSSSFGSWLKKIVINHSLDNLKRKKIKTVPMEESTMQIVESDWKVDDSISVDFIYDCIEMLPDKYSNVLKLYLLEGYDHQEISQILHIKEGVSRSQLSRGKHKLKELLKSKNYAS